MSSVSRFLQCGLSVIPLHLNISTVFEQQAHNLQHPMERGHVQRGPAVRSPRIYICTML
jgi:hypothetical protein